MDDLNYTYAYPHPAVTADCVIFGYDRGVLKILLVERGIDPYKGCWALPGGFMNIDETITECALRELREETGLECADIEQVGVFSSLGRDPRERVITVAHYALVRLSEVRAGDDASRAQWFELAALPPLAFDHAEIISRAAELLRQRIFFKPVGFELLPEVFTMGELQRLYEAILGVTFDRRNFASKMHKLELLLPVAERAEGTPSRIPTLYRFNAERYNSLKESGFRKEW